MRHLLEFLFTAVGFSPAGRPCLTEAEARNITARWLDVFSTPGVSSKAELGTIVAPDIRSWDDTFGPPTYGIDELWDAIAPGGNSSTTDVKQTATLLLHTCDQIAYNWEYTAVTTGFNSWVPSLLWAANDADVWWQIGPRRQARVVYGQRYPQGRPEEQAHLECHLVRRMDLVGAAVG